MNHSTTPCYVLLRLLVSKQHLTNYNLKPIIPPLLVVAQQKKEARRKVLEAVRERRKEMYKRFLKKMQLQADSDLL